MNTIIGLPFTDPRPEPAISRLGAVLVTAVSVIVASFALQFILAAVFP